MGILKSCAAPDCSNTFVAMRKEKDRRKYCCRACRDRHIPITDWSVKPGERRSRKTEFKKGNRPQTWVPVGSEAEMKGGYIKIKVAKPNVWRLRSHLVWEKVHGKPLPQGWIIRRRDGDPKNDDPANLEAMPRSKHIKRTLADPEIERRWKYRTSAATRRRHQDNRLAAFESFYWETDAHQS